MRDADFSILSKRGADGSARRSRAVRRARWRIVQVCAYEACQVVTLCGLAPPQQGLERRFVLPLDRVEPIVRPRVASCPRGHVAAPAVR
jgi:hypothetical protein